jgi:hypothetical protein
MVLNLGGQGGRGGGPGWGEHDREAVGEEVMYKGEGFWAGEINEVGRAKFDATIR